jgi:hypothetical protein
VKTLQTFYGEERKKSLTTIVSRGTTAIISHEKTCFIYDFITATFRKVSNNHSENYGFSCIFFSSFVPSFSTDEALKRFFYDSLYYHKEFYSLFIFSRVLISFTTTIINVCLHEMVSSIVREKKSLVQVSLPLTLPSSRFALSHPPLAIALCIVG